jgi:predicted N-acetyltransferase YhbS
VIREARAADDEAVGELLVRAFVARYAEKMPDVVVTERRQAELRDVAGKRAVAKVWVAEEEGRITGTVAVWPPGAHRSEAWLEGAFDLRHLAIDASRRGSGLSAALLEVAEGYARSSGAGAMCLHVRRGAVGLARMYMGRGYVRAPEGDIDHPEVMLEAFFKAL